MTNKDMLREIAMWARTHGKKAPKTKEGMKVLVAEYLAQHLAEQELAEQEAVDAAAHIEGDDGEHADPEAEEIAGGAAHYEIPDSHTVHLINDGSTVQIADPVKEGIFEDDWHRLLRDRAAAAIGPGGELLDDFDQEFQLGKKQHAALQEIAPFARTNPPTVVNNPLGGQTSIIANLQGRSQPITVAYWAGNDAETMPVSVLFSPVTLQKLFSTFVLLADKAAHRPVGIAQFGTRGFLTTIEVDILNGCQFTVPASMVTLQVAMEQIPPTGTVVTTATDFTGMLSFHPVNRTVPVTKTVWIDQLADATATFVRIPRFAQNVQVFRFCPAANSTPAFKIGIGNADDSQIYNQSVVANAIMTKMPLSGAASIVAITNQEGGGNAVDYNLIFELCV